MKKQVVSVPGSAPVSYLSRAVKFGNLLFVSGTTGRDPGTGKLAGEDITSQAKQTMENINSCLKAAGASMGDVLKMTCYMVNLADKKAFNAVYLSYFPENPPARACIGVSDLEPGVLVEIEAIVGLPGEE